MTYQIKCDIHTHTLYSMHAYSTILENISGAADAGLEVLGSADHFSCMTAVEANLRNYQFFINQEVWPREHKGVFVLRGAEADIVTLDGGLFGQDISPAQNISGRLFKREHTLFERCTESLDYLVASVHNDEFTKDASLAQTTQMYVGALENPKVFVLGHTGRSAVPFDLDEVLTVAKEKHKLIEINEHTFGQSKDGSNKACVKIAERCAELGVGITVSTDAHIATDIGRFDLSQRFLESIHFPQELIMNRSREVLLNEMALAGVCDLR